MSLLVVVVEDEPNVLDLLCELLEMEGARVIAVAHPGGLDEAIRNTHPDLFMIDIMLPSISGVELAEKLRSGGFADTPMAAMSASKIMCGIAESSGAFQEVLLKPFDLVEVLDFVERYSSPASVQSHGEA